MRIKFSVTKGHSYSRRYLRATRNLAKHIHEDKRMANRLTRHRMNHAVRVGLYDDVPAKTFLVTSRDVI